MLRSVFTVCTLFVAVLVFGGSSLLVGIVYASRWWLAKMSYGWGWVILKSSGVRLVVEGTEFLDERKPTFYVGNHQSALDIPVMFVVTRGRVRFLAKDSLFRIPVFGWVLWRYGYIPINRSNARDVHRRLESMLNDLRRHPDSFVVFPEGTRSEDGRLLPFRLGTMKICQRSGLDVVPFALNGTLAVHRRRQWRVRPGEVRVRMMERIPAAEASSTTPADLQRRVLSAIEAGLPPALRRPAASPASPPEAVPAVEG